MLKQIEKLIGVSLYLLTNSELEKSNVKVYYFIYNKLCEILSEITMYNIAGGK